MVELEKINERITYLASAKGFLPNLVGAIEAEERRLWHVRMCWMTLREAYLNSVVSHNVLVRIVLDRLREQLGFDAYYEGRMPSPCSEAWR